jgi:hypothetical protein
MEERPSTTTTSVVWGATLRMFSTATVKSRAIGMDVARPAGGIPLITRLSTPASTSGTVGKSWSR